MITFRESILFLSLLVCSACQQLRVEYTSETLPNGHGLYSHRVYYDGHDSIYVLGGMNWYGHQRILKYSVDSDKIMQVGTLPLDFLWGSVHADATGNLYLFGSGVWGRTRDVVKYDIIGNTTSVVAELPWIIQSSPTVKPCDSSQSDNVVFILGGDYSSNCSNNKILSFDLTDYKYSELPTTLPIDLSSGTAFCVDGRAFALPSFKPGDKSAWEFDFQSQTLSPVGKPDLPYLTSLPSSMLIDDSVFIVSGFRPNQTAEFWSQEGMLRFDAVTKSTEFISVENWPVKDGEEYYYTDAPQCAYVHKLTRIYCFGGRTNTLDGQKEKKPAEIFYIDMRNYQPTSSSPSKSTPHPTISSTTMSSTTLNPEWFTCFGKPDGFYPHPTDCGRFIACRKEELSHFACNPPSLFNPQTRTCDLPQNVICETSCVSRPDGYYSHPHDCALYIICERGTVNLIKCPQPLLFDPIQRFCNFPDIVNC